MKKLLIALLIILSSSIFANSEPVKVIPYPTGTDTKTEGASSAPWNINHEHSIYFDTMTDYFELKSNERRIILPHYPTYQRKRTRYRVCSDTFWKRRGLGNSNAFILGTFRSRPRHQGRKFRAYVRLETSGRS